MQKNIYLQLCFLFVFLNVVSGQNPDINISTQNKNAVTVFSAEQLNALEQFQEERIYISLDKSIYFPGETIWFSVFLQDAKELGKPALSEFVTVKFSNQDQSVIQAIKIIAFNGIAKGQFEVPNNLSTGSYQLKAYTRRSSVDTLGFVGTKLINIIGADQVNAHVMLSFGSESYQPGSLALFKGELLMADGTPMSNTDFSYSIVHKQKVYSRQLAYTEKDGSFNLAVQIPNEKRVPFQVRFDFVYQNKPYTLMHKIPIIGLPVQVEFYPEGGELIAGKSNRVGFYAQSYFQKSVNLKGKVVDQDGKKICTVNAHHLGRGYFDFVPTLGNRYFFIAQNLNGDSIFSLPQVLVDGWGFRLTNNGATQLGFQLSAAQSEKAFVIMHCRGKIVHQQAIEVQKGTQQVNLDLPSDLMGVAQISVLNAYGIEVLQRLVFIKTQKANEFSLVLNRQSFVSRNNAIATIELNKAKPIRPLNGNFTISVLKSDLVNLERPYQSNIYSALLLEPDLNLHVEHPSRYFLENGDVDSAGLEVLMLTAGWRRSDWRSFFNYLSHLDMPKPEVKMVSGYVKSAQTGKPERYVPISDEMGNRLTQTDGNGYFEIKTLDLSTPKTVYVGSKYFQSKFEVVDYGAILEFISPGVIGSYQVFYRTIPGAGVLTGTVRNLLTKEVVPNAIVSVFKDSTLHAVIKSDVQGKYKIMINPDESIFIQVAAPGFGVIEAKGIQIDYGKESVVNIGLPVKTAGEEVIAFDYRLPIYNANNSKSYKSVAQEVPMYLENQLFYIKQKHYSAQTLSAGVGLGSIKSNQLNSQSSTPFYLIGQTKSNINKNELPSNLAVYPNVDKEQFIISNEEMGNSRSKFPYRDSLTNVMEMSGIKSFTKKQPYHVAKEFPALQAKTEENYYEKDQSNNLLFWSGDVKLINGRADIPFYLGDNKGNYRVLVEGIGEDNMPYRKSVSFNTTPILEVFTNLPKEIMIGDTLIVPLQVVNNGTQSRSFKPFIKFGKGFEILELPEESYIILGSETQTILVKLVAKTYVEEAKIVFGVKGLGVEGFCGFDYRIGRR